MEIAVPFKYFIFLLLALNFKSYHSFKTSSSTTKPELRFVNVIFRHGDRTPETYPSKFPNDPHMFDKFYPTGSGGLTRSGKKRMYDFGVFLRQKYDSFLGSVYTEDSLYAISSDSARTKMSLQLLLAGLFPPTHPTQKWHDKLNWQPIPTTFIRRKDDTLLNRYRCQSFIDEITRIKAIPEIRKKLDEYKPFMTNLTSLVGKPQPVVDTDLYVLYYNFVIEREMNLTLAPWIEDLLNDGILEKRLLFEFDINNYSHRSKKLFAGAILNKVAKDMTAVRNSTMYNRRKVSLYSAHDGNVITTLGALGIYKPHIPQYSSAIIIELWYQNGEYYVKDLIVPKHQVYPSRILSVTLWALWAPAGALLYFNRYPGQDPLCHAQNSTRVLHYKGIPSVAIEVQIPQCTKPCPLDKYLILTKPVTLTDDEIPCTLAY